MTAGKKEDHGPRLGAEPCREVSSISTMINSHQSWPCFKWAMKEISLILPKETKHC